MARKPKAPAPDQPHEAAEATTSAESSAELARLREESESLRLARDEAKALAEERLQNWQRAQADLSNYRRRIEQEQADRAKYAAAPLLGNLVTVLDDFERAWAALPAELRGLSWVSGIIQIDLKLQSILRAHGVTPLEAVGKPFDPYTHEAIMREDLPPEELTHVVAELQRGYQLHERVLRPSLVRVGKAPAAAEAGQAADDFGRAPDDSGATNSDS